MAVTGKPTRLSKAAREFNVGLATIVEFLAKKGIEISNSPNTKLDPEMYELLTLEFQSEKTVKEEAEKIGLDYADHQTVSLDDKIISERKLEDEDEFDDVFIKENLLKRQQKDETTEVVKEDLPKEEPKKEAPKKKEDLKKADKAEKELEKVEDKAKKETSTAKKKTAKPTVAKENVKKEVEVKSEEEKPEKEEEADGQPKIVGKIDLEKINLKTKPDKKSAEEKKKEREEKTKLKKE